MYDSNGKVKPTRLSALLNAALGHVAGQTEGFIDFDAVPEDGASSVCAVPQGKDAALYGHSRAACLHAPARVAVKPDKHGKMCGRQLAIA